MSIFKLNGHNYRIQRLDVFQCYDLASRLAPVCGILAMSKDRAAMIEGFPRALASLTGGMSSDERRNSLHIALAAVSRVEGDSVVPVCVDGVMQYQDIEMTDMLRLVCEVLVVNKIIDFFSVPESKSTVETLDASQGSNMSSSRTGGAG